MGNNKRHLGYLHETSKSPKIQTKIIDNKIARELPVLFGFKNLDLNKSPFNCSIKHASSLLYVFQILSLFSKTMRKQVDISFKNCHPVPEDQVKKHNLSYFVSLAPNNKLHQLGRKRTKERIIGYYDNQINLFQICLLDLNHKLSGD